MFVEESGPQVYPPAAFLEPWTLRLLRRVADGRESLTVLAARARRQHRVTTALDPVIERHLNETAAAWAADTIEEDPLLAVDGVEALAGAALQAGYLFGRLLVGTADVDQRWSDVADRDELAYWLDEVVPMIEWSAISELFGADTTTLAAVMAPVLTEHDPDGEAARRTPVFFDNGLCVALVEHSAHRPLANHGWVDLTVLEDVLPDDTMERVWIGEALGCLLARVDRRGRCSESDLRDAADELGGERGRRYFEQLRRWGIVDYERTRRGGCVVRVRRHRELRGGAGGRPTTPVRASGSRP